MENLAVPSTVLSPFINLAKKCLKCAKHLGRRLLFTSGLSTMACAKSTNSRLATDSGAELLHLIRDTCQVLVQKFCTQNDKNNLSKWSSTQNVILRSILIKFDHFYPCPWSVLAHFWSKVQFRAKTDKGSPKFYPFLRFLSRIKSLYASKFAYYRRDFLIFGQTFSLKIKRVFLGHFSSFLNEL